MRLLLICALVALALPAAGLAAPAVSIFYYPWYGTPALDGVYQHWSQAGHEPPDDIASSFYPAARRVLVERPGRRRLADGRDQGGRDRPGRRLVVGARLGRGRAAAARDRGGAAGRARRSPRTSSRTRSARSRASSPTSTTCARSGSARSTSSGRSTSRATSGPRRTTSLAGVQVYAQTALVGAAAEGPLRRRLHLRRPHLRRRHLRPALRRGARAPPALPAVGRAGLRRAALRGRPAR